MSSSSSSKTAVESAAQLLRACVATQRQLKQPGSSGLKHKKHKKENVVVSSRMQLHLQLF